MLRHIDYKRENIRFNAKNLEVRYCYNGTYIDCHIINISDKGMQLRVKQIFAVGDILTVTYASARRPFEIKCEVRHVNGMKVGLQYVKEDYFDEKELEEFVSSVLDTCKKDRRDWYSY